MSRDGSKRRGITERVQFKFVLSFCALLAGLIVLLNTYPIAASRDLVASEKESSLLSQASVISSSLSTLSPLEPESVGQVMDLLELSSSGRIVVTDELGIILYDTGSPSGKGKAAMLAEVALALEGKQVFHSVFSGGAFVSTAAMPVRAGGVTLGAVYVQEHDTAQAELILSIQNRLVTISIAASVAALALTVVFSRALTRRITRLAEAIRVVRGGDYAHRLKPEGNDELTELCEEFNNMTQTLETTEQQRRRFVSDASHELKTPLAAIRLLADSIEQNADMDEATMREFVSDIGTEADRLQRTTEKLLDLSRRDDGVQAARVPVDLGEVARSTLRLLSPLAEGLGVTLRCEPEPGCIISASEDDVYQIVFNLAENAVKYNVEGGSVDIRVRRGEGRILLDVEDTGIGIPEADLPNIFSRFYRVDQGALPRKGRQRSGTLDSPRRGDGPGRQHHGRGPGGRGHALFRVLPGAGRGGAAVKRRIIAALCLALALLTLASCGQAALTVEVWRRTADAEHSVSEGLIQSERRSVQAQAGSINGAVSAFNAEPEDPASPARHPGTQRSSPGGWRARSCGSRSRPGGRSSPASTARWPTAAPCSPSAPSRAWTAFRYIPSARGSQGPWTRAI